MANIVNNTFSRIYYWLLLSGYFYLGLLLGGVFGGFLPSLAAVVTMHKEASNQFQMLRFQEYWHHYKGNLQQSWRDSLYYCAVMALILWMIWFTSQFQGFIFLMSIMIQVCGLVIVHQGLLSESQLRQVIDTSSLNFKKFAFIHFFSFSKLTLLNVLYSFIILASLITMPAVAFIFGIPIWVSLFTRLYQEAYIESGWIDEPEDCISK